MIGSVPFSHLFIKIKMFIYYILCNPLQIMIMHCSECAVTLNCTNFTLDSFFNTLGEILVSQKIHRPVKMLSDSLNVSIDITVVGILGVVSLRSKQVR